MDTVEKHQRWLRHPLSTAAARIAFRYCERRGLEIRFAEPLDGGIPECTCSPSEGCTDCPPGDRWAELEKAEAADEAAPVMLGSCATCDGGGCRDCID